MSFSWKHKILVYFYKTATYRCPFTVLSLSQFLRAFRKTYNGDEIIF